MHASLLSWALFGPRDHATDLLSYSNTTGNNNAHKGIIKLAGLWMQLAVAQHKTMRTHFCPSVTAAQATRSI